MNVRLRDSETPQRDSFFSISAAGRTLSSMESARISFPSLDTDAFILSDASQDSETDGKDYWIALTRRKPRELPR